MSVKIDEDNFRFKAPSLRFVSSSINETKMISKKPLFCRIGEAHKVQEIFALCGGHISGILVAAEKLGIQVIDTRHEATAVFAADAVARLRQDIGVAAVTAGPGVTNTITAVKNAQMAEIPVVLLGGAAPILLKNRGALQDIDQLSLFKPVCKYYTSVTRVLDIVKKLRKAIWIAKSGTPGPVFVELPVDLLYPYEIIEKEMGFISHPKNITQNIVNFYLRYHLSQLFSQAWIERAITEIPPIISYAEKPIICKVADLVMDAKRPLLLIGSQALLPPIKADDLQAIVKSLGIPTYLGGMARGLLGSSSPLQMRQNRKEALKEADLVILAGMVCDFRLAYGRSLPSHGKIIAINRSKGQARLNEGIFWKATSFIDADVASSLKMLNEILVERAYKGCPADWLKTLSDREVAKCNANEQKAKEPVPEGKLNPLRVLHVVDKVLPENTILVVDGGDFVGSAAYIVRARTPLGWLDPGAFGTLGVGGGFALGAKVVFPDRPVFIIFGDGACGYSLIEFDTYSRHRFSVGAIIGNDACWSQIARDQMSMFNSNVAVCLSHSHYERIAEAFDAKGEYIDGTEEERLGFRFKAAVEEVLKGNSVIMNVIIGKSNFRDGSISL
ncbi:unnamed protein product [Enterobius vermicularis]|uniref:2-hydroxyacyl-CoA lyase 2 n=1 Tax=Enterobius vermicularis TaxID=51028 RepID=A0A0N4UY40_ENTVE|nr:unnamed protein product [Enterobius vermicularis]